METSLKAGTWLSVRQNPSPWPVDLDPLLWNVTTVRAGTCQATTMPGTQLASSKYFLNEWNLGAQKCVSLRLKWYFHCVKMEKKQSLLRELCVFYVKIIWMTITTTETAHKAPIWKSLVRPFMDTLYVNLTRILESRYFYRFPCSLRKLRLKVFNYLSQGHTASKESTRIQTHDHRFSFHSISVLCTHMLIHS